MGFDIQHAADLGRVTVVFDGHLGAEEGATSAAVFRVPNQSWIGGRQGAADGK